jgi:hypothetical protein
MLCAIMLNVVAPSFNDPVLFHNVPSFHFLFSAMVESLACLLKLSSYSDI